MIVRQRSLLLSVGRHQDESVFRFPRNPIVVRRPGRRRVGNAVGSKDDRSLATSNPHFRELPLTVCPLRVGDPVSIARPAGRALKALVRRGQEWNGRAAGYLRDPNPEGPDWLVRISLICKPLPVGGEARRAGHGGLNAVPE